MYIFRYQSIYVKNTLEMSIGGFFMNVLLEEWIYPATRTYSRGNNFFYGRTRPSAHTVCACLLAVSVVCGLDGHLPHPAPPRRDGRGPRDYHRSIKFNQALSASTFHLFAIQFHSTFQSRSFKHTLRKVFLPIFQSIFSTAIL